MQVTVSQAIKSVMAAHGVNTAQLARRLGVPRTNISSRLNRSKAMRMDNVAQMLGALGYEVAFVPKGATLPRGAVVPDEWGGADAEGGEE